MHRLDVRLLLPALVAWAGVAASLGWSIASRLVLGGCALIGALISLWARGRISGDPSGSRVRAAAGLLALTGVVTGALLIGSGLHRAIDETGPMGHLAAQERWVSGMGRVSEQPRIIVTKRGQRMVFVRIRLTEIADAGASLTRVRSPVLLVADERWAQVQWRDQVRFAGRASTSDDAGLVAQIRVRGAPEVGPRASWLRATDQLRAGLRDAMRDKPADSAGLLPALVVGDTSLTPASLTQAMRVTGLSHLSAVSGTNCVMVLLAALGLARLARLPRRGQVVVAAGALLFFVALARPEPSVLRAATMGVVGLIAMVSARSGAGAAALAASMISLLMVDPGLSRSYGFALSVAATAGLIILAPGWAQAWGDHLPSRWRWLAPVLAIPVAAQVATAPILILLQPSVATFTVLANALAEPVVAPATLLGVAIALIAPVTSTLAQWLGWLAVLPTGWIAGVARVVAHLPGASVPWPSGGWGALGLAGVLLVLVLTAPRLRWQIRERPGRSLACSIWAISLVMPSQLLVGPLANWLMVACDVGQGDGLLIRTASDRAIVVDTGPEPESMTACLGRWRIRAVDTLFITHFHADHAGGAAGLLEQMPVGAIYAPPLTQEEQWSSQLGQAAQLAQVPIQQVWAGDRVVISGVDLAIWWPAWKVSDGSIPNNNSLVMTVSAGPLRALMMGDIEREAGAAVRGLAARDPVEAEALSQANVLKVAHHGSDNLDAELLRGLSAQIALISVGEGNDYGHPRPQLLAELAAEGRQAWRTDQSGDIAIVSADGGLGVIPEKR